MKNTDIYLIDETKAQQKYNDIQKIIYSFETIALNIVTSVGFIIALVLIAVNVEAAEHNENNLSDNVVKISDVHQGTLLFKSDTDENSYTIAPTLETDVTMKVSGMLVRTKLIQRFKNETSNWIEGLYVFPLPESAAVDHMKLRIGERTIEGQIKERVEAKRIYTAAKRAGKKASLIEQQRPNLFTNSVANIGPGEIVIVEIEYQQILKYDNGQFKLRFPTTLTPRYIPGSSSNTAVTLNREKISSDTKNSGWIFKSTSVSDASEITPPQNSTVKNPINIKVELNAGFAVSDISSSYHKIKSVMHLEGQYTVSLLNEDVPSDRDFELVWTPELGNAPKAALFTESNEQQDYHFVMIMPPANSDTNQVLARDVTYIIDTSGSMHGESMRQAKSALQLAITRLRSFDRFNIIEFDSSTNSLFPSSRFAIAENTFIAKNFVNRLTADGGTEMLPALQAALTAENKPGFIRQVIFLTDGSVGNEDQLFRFIKNNLGASRLFTVAIGSSPNSHFMTKAAKFGRGTYTYIGKIAEVNEKMSALFSKLEKPVMQNVNINWPKGTDVEIWPKRLPDLYAGEPLIFTARVNKNSAITSNSIDNKLLIEGKRNLQQWQMELDLNANKHDSGVGVLWARNKITSIMDGILEYRNNSTSEVVADLKEKIIKLALDHHLVSKYTSLVAVDTTPTRPVFEGLQVAALANSIPRGSANKRVVQGQYAQTATSAQLHIVLGLMLLLICLLLLIRPGFLFKLDFLTKQSRKTKAYIVVG